MNRRVISSGSEPELSVLLEAWQVKDPVTADFKAGVWRRIAGDAGVAEGGAERVILAWLDRLFARRWWSVGYALVLLGAGLVTGYWRAAEQTARWDQVMATRYVQSVDPVFQAGRQR